MNKPAAYKPALLLAFGVAVACAPMLSAADCALSGGEFGQDAPIDARAGVIAFDDWSAGAVSVTRRNFLDCGTGTGLQVAYQSSTGLNLKPEVDALTFSVVEGDRITQFRDGLSLMGIGFSDISYTTETCGCRVFYPEDRGTKKPYEATI